MERGYGLTEASPGVTTTVGGEILGPFHVGRPLPGVEVRVGDGLDPSEPGEISVRGANLFSGYWPDGPVDRTRTAGSRPVTSASRPTASCSWSTGPARSSSVSGFTVYPSEVEQSIRQLTEVEAVAVVGRSTGGAGEAGHGLVAFVAGPGVTA